MPGLSLPRPDPRILLSPEDAIAAEQSLSMYCKPVEFYNILERRAARNPSFLQRSLIYKIEAKHKRRLKMTVSLSRAMNQDEQVQGIFPLYVLLATTVPGRSTGAHSAVFRCRTQAQILKSLCEFENNERSEANFVLPERNKLSDESGSGKFFILLVSCGSRRNFASGGNPLNGQMDNSTGPVSIGGYCLLGKFPLDSCMSRNNTRSDHGSGMLSLVEMHACFLEPSSLEKEQCITFKTPDCPVTMPVQVNILTQEGGEKDKSPYATFIHSGHRASSFPHITRIRTGNVVFNYKYFNNLLQKTEITEDFTCAFCLVKCASFKGLMFHLGASHDLFDYVFWVTEQYQAVDVHVKTNVWRSITADRVDPRLQTFSWCSKRLKRTPSKHSSQNAKHVHTSDQKLDSCEVTRNGFLNGHQEKEATTRSLPVPGITNPVDTDRSDQFPLVYDNQTQSSKQRDKAQKVLLNDNGFGNGNNGESNGAMYTSIAECLDHVVSIPNGTGVSVATNLSSADLECLPLVSEKNIVPPAMLQFAKSRKLSADRSDPRNRILLQKRQFFHSHRAQPMELEQVLSDCDSEDEVDDDIADLEDRRMLDDFVDVTKDEKRMMHLWNSFLRKQRVLADGHIPWTCEAFSKMHGLELAKSPQLFWCWRLFMIKLWNHCLLDASTMNKCNTILSEFKNDNTDPYKGKEVNIQLTGMI